MKSKPVYDALVLFSGGLDSATVLYQVKKDRTPLVLILKYGQLHSREVDGARRIARQAGVDYKVLSMPFPDTGSSLLDGREKIPSRLSSKIPSTYVPARNTVFISMAASYAESLGINEIYVGVNAVDYSGYPDCRPEYIRSFNRLLALATKTGVSGKPIRIKAPLIKKTKAQIIRAGIKLGVPYDMTWSCYKGGKKPCGTCDSCRLRARGFKEAGIHDPAL